MAKRLSSRQRACNCMRAVDRLWERCQQGVDYVYGPDLVNGMTITRTRRREAARLLIKLMQAANRLTLTARAADPSVVERWEAKWKKHYHTLGWDWPDETREEARTQDAARIRQLAFEDAR